MNDQSNPINLTEIPIRVADALNVDVFCGGIFCSIVLMLILVLPVIILVRGKSQSWILEVSTTLIVMGICVGIGWLSQWFILIVALITALMIYDFIKRRSQP